MSTWIRRWRPVDNQRLDRAVRCCCFALRNTSRRVEALRIGDDETRPGGSRGARQVRHGYDAPAPRPPVTTYPRAVSRGRAADRAIDEIVPTTSAAPSGRRRVTVSSRRRADLWWRAGMMTTSRQIGVRHQLSGIARRVAIPHRGIPEHGPISTHLYSPPYPHAREVDCH